MNGRGFEGTYFSADYPQGGDALSTVQVLFDNGKRAAFALGSVQDWEGELDCIFDLLNVQAVVSVKQYGMELLNSDSGKENTVEEIAQRIEGILLHKGCPFN